VQQLQGGRFAVVGLLPLLQRGGDLGEVRPGDWWQCLCGGVAYRSVVDSSEEQRDCATEPSGGEQGDQSG